MQKVSLDVLEEICEHVKDATTLRSVALTCRGGRRAGQRHLFRALKFVKLNNPEVLIGDVDRTLARSDCPISRYIHNLTFHDIHGLRYETLASLMSRMTQLKTLSVMECSLTYTPGSALCEQKNSTSLKTLSLHGVCVESSPSMMAFLLQDLFHRSQRWDLVSLERITRPVGQVATIAAPNARSLHIGYSMGTNDLDTVRVTAGENAGLEYLTVRQLKVSDVPELSAVIRANVGTLRDIFLCGGATRLRVDPADPVRKLTCPECSVNAH